MSDGDKHILNVVKQVLNEELKSIVAIFQANQPTESSRMARLVSDTIETSLKPIKEHLNNQDVAIADIQTKLQKLTTDTEPLVEGKKTASNIFRFVAWASPLAIIYGALKWAKIL